RGRYDHGPEANAGWFAEVGELERALAAFAPRGDVLELACGTGQWTPKLAEHAAHLTAVDASPEVLELNRARLAGCPTPLEWVQADVFQWRPERRYDVVFFSFWLSHVPTERFDAFWRTVQEALKPAGRVFFIDSRANAASTAKDQPLPGEGSETMERRLNDGRRYRIVKVFYEPAPLTARLAALGWSADIKTTASHFVYGSVWR
ncbi:MAG TPA: class I SAM-dependent methyltransferase, partial [Limnochordia bacterium]|nr:class I SAM-dependent methyltransferase [Limnochordia bacterium]